MNLYKASFIFFALVVSVYTISAQSDIETGWDYISKNDYTNAQKHFEQALDGENKHLAHLGLSFVGSAINDNDLRLNHYKEFYYSASNPDPYLIALWAGTEMIDYSDPGPYIDLLEDIIESRNGTLYCFANETLGAYYKSINKLSKAKDYFDQIGSIEKWQLVGEFENISESGFNVDHGPLNHPESDFGFANKRGVEVHWFDIESARPDKWVDFAYHFYITNSIIYAQNWVNSPDDREVQIRIGTSGSLKCWVNDHLIFSEQKERNNGLDTYVFTAQLKRGYNRLLLQIGASEIDRSNFLLRITDDKGNNITDLTYSNEMKEYPVQYSYDSRIVEDETEKYFKANLKEDPDNLQDLIALSQHYLKNDMVYASKKVLKQAKELYPDCSYLTFQLIETYYRDDNRTGVSTYIEELKDKDPDGIQSLNLLFDEAMDIEDYKEAERLLTSIQMKEGYTANYYEKKIELLSEKKEVEELIKTANIAYTEYPEDWTFILIKYYLEKEVKKNVSDGIKVVKKYSKDRYNSEAINILVENYFSQGDVNGGIKEFEKLLEHNPLATGYYNQLSGIYFSLGNYSEAKKMAEKCLEIAPYAGTYYSTLAQAYQEMGQDSKAEEAFRKAIKYNPYDYETRGLLRNHLDEKEIFSSFEDFDIFSKLDVYDIYEDSPESTAYPEDNSVILIDEVQRVVYDGGGSEERHVFAVKVFNSSGVDRWKEYYIPIYGNQSGILEKAEVLKFNGSKLTAEQSGSHVVFTNLEPGDAINLVYKVRNFYSEKLSNHFWDKFHLNSYYPKLHSRYSLLVPKGRQFVHEVVGGTLPPEKSSGDKFEMYVWEKNDVESIKYEPYMSHLSDVGMVLHVSSFKNWDYIAEWYAGLAQAKSKPDFEVQEAVADLFEGKENLSSMDKVKEIYHFITANIRYSSVPFIQSGLVPQKAARVISTKQGDCKDVSTLFVSMCKTQGIDANLVLVNTRDQGQNDMVLPSISFNHCIAKVNINEEEYFVELTSENLPFAAGGSSLKNVFALEIPQDPKIIAEAGIIDPKNRPENNVKRQATVTFTGDIMTVEKECFKSGVNASGMRNAYKNEGKETQFKNMQEAITGRYATMKLLDLQFINGLHNEDEVVHYKYKYEVPNVYNKISSFSIFKLPWADGLTSPDFISNELRKFPVELWRYFSGDHYEEIITIIPPTEMSISEIPSNVVLKNEYISYSVTYEQRGSNVVITRKFDLLKDKVDVADYSAFKDFFGKIVKSDEQNLAFR